MPRVKRSFYLETRTVTSKTQDGNTRKLKLIYSKFQFEQKIKEHTKVATHKDSQGEPKVTKTLIDHYSTNRPNNISACGVIKVGITDHYVIYGIRKINARVNNIRDPNVSHRMQYNTEFRNLKNYDSAAFLQELQRVDFQSVISACSGDPNLMAKNFIDLFLSILYIHAPLKRGSARQRRSPAPCLSSKIRKLMRDRDKYKILAEKNQMMWSRYRKLRNKVTAELRKSVEAYYKSLVDETSHNPKEMWKTVNKVLNKDRARMFPSSVTYNGSNIKKPNEIAEAVNDHFATIGPKLASKIRSTIADDHLQYLSTDFSSTVPLFAFKRVDEHLLKREINKLKCSNSPGHDKIPVKVIKDAVNILAKPLAAIFNAAMEEGVFPDAWKLVMITLIHKSRKKFELSNYKPISVLSVLSKLFEKIVHDQVSTFMRENELFSNCHYGFRQLHSTVTSLLGVTDMAFQH